jgi:phosphoribosylglycinamide formyltransferase 1
MITFAKKIALNKLISIFASGSGTNAEKLILHFSSHATISINAIFTNKENAGVIEIARKHQVPVFHFSNNSFENGVDVLNKLKEIRTDFIVLAGFLRKIPENIIRAYADKIINIHPSLLPKHGGKNMYGNRVHEAVLQSGDKETGITIHLVNEEYDKGLILAQFSCAVESEMTTEQIAKAVQALEHEYYKSTIEKFIEHV